MNFKKKRGFTLIELLVVIAIIGILSSVVLASLNTARDKGRDGAIKSSMQTIRVQSEIFYDLDSVASPCGGFCYGDQEGAGGVGCGVANSVFTEQTIVAALADVDSNSPAAPVCVTDNLVNGGSQEWAVATQLRSGTWWCTDYRGVAREDAAATIAAGDAECG
jgi:prepilin-type N-terminal cleavage/methylation domain-containing protein